MDGIMIVALLIAIPVILFPAAFIWYMNIGGIIHALREAKARQKEAAPAPVASK